MSITKERAEIAVRLAQSLVKFLDEAEPEVEFEEAMVALDVAKCLLPLIGMRGRNFTF